MPSIAIVNPASTLNNYTAEALCVGDQHFVQVADLAIATVAAFVPSHWAISLCDEGIEPVDLSCDAQFIALTGKVSQRARLFELADHFRARGQTVIIGGSFATLTPDDVRDHCDILFTGELEDIAPAFFADLEAGRWKDHYDGGQADIARAPLPRWDLYPLDRAFCGAVQTSRGCPFNCEFCDVIQYQGRKQRHKPVANVIAELDQLYALGCRSVFLVDDNFTVHRRHAEALLDALIAWNDARPGDRMTFLTQASLDVARERELLSKCRRAGLRTLFVGVETNNAESLIETGKKQNLLMPTQDALEIILAHGIAPMAGFIVGFDHDDAGIFDSMFDFIQACPLPDANPGVLTAPRQTHLYRRLQREGRLLGEVWEASAGAIFSTNVQPLLMSREALLSGARRLATKLLEPANFEARMERFMALYGADEGAAPEQASTHGRSFAHVFLRVLQQLSKRGPDEAAMITGILRRATRKPATLPSVMLFLARYAQARYVLDAVAPADIRDERQIAHA